MAGAGRSPDLVAACGCLRAVLSHPAVLVPHRRVAGQSAGGAGGGDTDDAGPALSGAGGIDHPGRSLVRIRDGDTLLPADRSAQALCDCRFADRADLYSNRHLSALPDRHGGAHLRLSPRLAPPGLVPDSGIRAGGVAGVSSAGVRIFRRASRVLDCRGTQRAAESRGPRSHPHQPIRGIPEGLAAALHHRGVWWRACFIW